MYVGAYSFQDKDGCYITRIQPASIDSSTANQSSQFFDGLCILQPQYSTDTLWNVSKLIL